MPSSRVRSRCAVIIALLAASSATAHIAAQAQADSNADAFFLSIKPNAIVNPVLHAREGLGAPDSGREYDYTTKGYFKVGGRTVARLPTIRGHAEAIRQHLRLRVRRSTRSKINAAARRRDTRRVTLTLVHRITLTTNVPGDMAPRSETLTQQVPLRVARR